MKTETAILGGAALIALSIAVVERYQISAVGYGYGTGDDASNNEVVYRLDRWTGETMYCSVRLGGKSFNDSAERGQPLPVPCAKAADKQ